MSDIDPAFLQDAAAVFGAVDDFNLVAGDDFAASGEAFGAVAGLMPAPPVAPTRSVTPAYGWRDARYGALAHDVGGTFGTVGGDANGSAGAAVTSRDVKAAGLGALVGLVLGLLLGLFVASPQRPSLMLPPPRGVSGAWPRGWEA